MHRSVPLGGARDVPRDVAVQRSEADEDRRPVLRTIDALRAPASSIPDARPERPVRPGEQRGGPAAGRSHGAGDARRTTQRPVTMSVTGR
ncbi:hypothetical protein FM103_10875 [Corynebacterium xerosis]|nr:hypothetical protein FM103_10875 [Corynebacterium xerosis]